MHKIAFEPKAPYELWANGSGAERRHHARLLLDSKDSRKVSSRVPRVVNNTVCSCTAVSQPAGGQ